MFDLNNSVVAFSGREVFSKGLDASFYKEFPLVRQIFECAGQYMNCDISKKCYSGCYVEPQWETICLITHCYSIYKVIEELYGIPAAFAGYSQGEFTAGTSAQAFKFPDILEMNLQLELLLSHGHNAEEVMYRFVDITMEELQHCCSLIDAAGKNICISAYISQTQNIVSGKKEYMQQLVPLAKKNGARWAINLHAAKGFHSPLYEEEGLKSQPYFHAIALDEAIRPVYSCYDGTCSLESAIIKDKLSKQINHPIRWNIVADNMAAANTGYLVEIGPGCTVSGNTRIANHRITCTWINSTKDLR